MVRGWGGGDEKWRRRRTCSLVRLRRGGGAGKAPRISASTLAPFLMYLSWSDFTMLSVDLTAHAMACFVKLPPRDP